jgi:hypothetical protein
MAHEKAFSKDTQDIGNHRLGRAVIGTGEQYLLRRGTTCVF